MALQPGPEDSWQPMVPDLGRALARVAQFWPSALALYLPGAALALLAALPVWLGMSTLASLGTWVERMARGDYVEVWLEIGASFAAAGVLEESPPDALVGLGGSLFLALALSVVALVGQGLAYTFVAGGLLHQLSAGPRPGFWAACRYWFWPMFRFGLLAVAVFMLGAAAGLALIGLIPLGGSAGAILTSAALAVWLSCLNGWLEAGRAAMVLHGDRTALHALARAWGIVNRGPLLGRALLGWSVLALLAVVHVGVAALLHLVVPAMAVGASFAALQLASLVGAELKLLRLAWAVELAESAQGRAHDWVEFPDPKGGI